MKFKLRGVLLVIGVAIFLLNGSYRDCLVDTTTGGLDENKLTFGANVRFRYEFMNNFNLKYY